MECVAGRRRRRLKSPVLLIQAMTIATSRFNRPSTSLARLDLLKLLTKSW